MPFNKDFRQLSQFVMNYCVIEINKILQNLFYSVYLDFQSLFNIK